METLHRLFLLDRLFRSHKYPISVNAFLTQMECSFSTFKRLIKVLREQYNYPIVFSKEHKGYYYDYTKATQVSGLWFTTHELQALLIIQQMLQQLQPGLLSEYFDSLAKHVNRLLALSGKMPNNLVKRIHVIPIAHQYIRSDIFLPLCQATLYHHTIYMRYQDIHGSYSERTVSPQRLTYYRNNWYLDAWCHLREGLRTFWVAGIQSLELTEQTANCVEEKILEAHLASSYGIFTGLPSQTAHLRFTGLAAMRVRNSEWHPSQQSQNNEDGSIEFWIPYSDHRELVMDIMRYGAEVTVLGPDTLRKEVLQQFKKAVMNYQSVEEEKNLA